MCKILNQIFAILGTRRTTLFFFDNSATYLPIHLNPAKINGPDGIFSCALDN